MRQASHARRSWHRLFVAALPVLLCTTWSAPSSAAVRPASEARAGWIVPVPVAPSQGDITSVACITSTQCEAVDAAGRLLSWSDGRWGKPESLIDPRQANLQSISCMSATSCIALTRSFETLVENGSTWTGPETLDTGLIQAACPSSTFCVGLTVAGVVEVTRTGAAWNTPVLGLAVSGLYRLACASSSFCMAVGDAKVGGDDEVVSYTFDGTTWSGPVTVTGAIASGVPQHLGCASPILCVLSLFPEAGGTGETVYVDDGTGWSPAATIGQTGVQVLSIACTTSQCLTLDADGSAGEVPVATDSWSSIGSFPGALSNAHEGIVGGTAACSGSSCLAVVQFGDGTSLSSTYDDTAWSAPVSADPLGGGLASITCPSPETCVAQEPGGDLLHHAAGRWSAPALPAIPGSWRAGWYLGPISCATPSFCAVPWDGRTQLPGIAVHGPRGWSRPGYQRTQAPVVSCPVAGFCLVLVTPNATNPPSEYGASPQYATYRNGRWSVLRPTALSADLVPHELSCVSPTFCVAVAIVSSALQYTVYDGATWSKLRPLPTVLYGAQVTCASQTMCLVVGASDSPSSFAEATMFDGTRWSRPVVLGRDLVLTGASCASATFCVAIDRQGQAFTFDGRKWSGPRDIDPVNPSIATMVAVSCAVTSCTAVDSAGYASTYIAPRTQQ